MASAKHTTTKKTSRKVKPVEDEERVDMVALVTSNGEVAAVGRDEVELADKFQESIDSCEEGWGAYNEEKKKNRKLEEQLKKEKEKHKITMDKFKKARLGKTTLAKELKKKGQQYKNQKNINKQITKTLVCLIGQNLTKENPDCFPIGLLTSAVKKCLSDSNMTLFGTMIDGTDYDIEASIRSYVYEMSPSSAQFWFKFGKATNAKLPTSGFINRPLANRNAELNWEVSQPGKGRAVAAARDEWIYVSKFKHLKNGDWNADKYGPIPQPGYGIGDDRPQGRRGGGGAATYERDE